MLTRHVWNIQSKKHRTSLFRNGTIRKKGWRFHHEKTGQSFMDEYFMFHASRGF